MPGKKARGKRAKTRQKLRHGKKLSINKLLADLSTGSRVQVCIDSSIHKGMPHHRFQGKTGKVMGKRGRAFVVDLMDGNKEKQLIIKAAHLKELK